MGVIKGNAKNLDSSSSSLLTASGCSERVGGLQEDLDVTMKTPKTA